MGQAEWERQVKEMEKLVQEVEGDDDRSYGSDEAKKVQ
jgi:Delta7-sterol 5-desaturase